ncbi:MAG: hypothetical protein NXI19_01285 [Alphaproteobacteria bacterium]|nr:hypothetical protein [Alphaproteobacteria bacterium]
MGLMNILGFGGAEKDGRRAAARLDAIGSVRIDSKTYPLVNWSASGLLISGHSDHLAKGQVCSITVSVEDDGKRIEFGCKAIVVRLQGDRLAMNFQLLNKVHKMTVLEYFQRHGAR